jgi:hypothetical protein
MRPKEAIKFPKVRYLLSQGKRWDPNQTPWPSTQIQSSLHLSILLPICTANGKMYLTGKGKGK